MSIGKKITVLIATLVTVAMGVILTVTNYYGAKVFSELEASGIDITSSLGMMKWVVFLVTLGVFVLTITGTWMVVRKYLTNPLKKMKEDSTMLAMGQTNFEPNQDLMKRTDEMGELYQAIDKIRDDIDDKSALIERIARGETGIKIQVNSDEDKINVSLKKLVDNVNEVTATMNTITGNVRHGALREKVDLSHLEGVWKTYPQKLDESSAVFVKIFDSLPLIVAAFNKDYSIEFMNATGEKVLGKTSDNLKGTKCFDSFKTDQCNTEKCACRQSMASNLVVREETISRAGDSPMDIDYIGVPLENESGDIIGAFEIVLDQTKIMTAQRVAGKQSDYQAKQLSYLLANLDKMSKGHLDIEAKVDAGDKDTKILELTYQSISDNLNNSVNAIKSYIEEIAKVLSEMASKNMDISIEREYLGDFTQLKDSINHILSVFNDTLEEIEQAAVQVDIGTNQVAESSQNLSQGSAEQASSVEEIGATVSQIAEQTKQNAQNANNANKISTSVKVDANQGNSKMKYMLKAMEEIKNSSNNINSIIKVIDDIAFQTNILALNAAVEAARAGEHGKGFAVVAEEVRNLAARSASAAKETTDMIDLSISKVNEGYSLANETADALQKIVQGVEETVNIVEAIAEASVQQAAAVSQIDDGINQISQVTQMNTSTAEESASASEQMASQAQYLKAMINEFKLTHRN
jgi:methyl-accepting chemotaxis protein